MDFFFLLPSSLRVGGRSSCSKLLASAVEQLTCSPNSREGKEGKGTHSHFIYTMLEATADVLLLSRRLMASLQTRVSSQNSSSSMLEVKFPRVFCKPAASTKTQQPARTVVQRHRRKERPHKSAHRTEDTDMLPFRRLAASGPALVALGFAACGTEAFCCRTTTEGWGLVSRCGPSRSLREAAWLPRWR